MTLPARWAWPLAARLHCVFQRDPAARTRFEVLTTYPGVHAILGHRLAHQLWTRGWRYPARLLSFAVRLFTNVDIHPGAVIGRRFFIDHGACVVIGKNPPVGDDVTLYHGVTLGGTSWKQGKRHPPCRMLGWWWAPAPRFSGRCGWPARAGGGPIRW